MMMRGLLVCLIGLLLLGLPVFAQEAAPTPENLLDALYVVWHQYGRQPTAAEMDEKGTYPSQAYLRVWENWEQARQALVEHLYQKGLFAALQGDKEKTAEYYRMCLEVDPTHAKAREGLAGAVGVDLEKVATERAQFTVEEAGLQAVSAYESFLAYRTGGWTKRPGSNTCWRDG